MSEPRMAFAAKKGYVGLGYWVFLHAGDTVSHPEWGETPIARYVITLGERVKLVD